MELPSDEFATLQLQRIVKIQLGGLLPNIAKLPLMSIGCLNKLVAITQSTELFVQPQLECSYLENVQMDYETEEVANVKKTLNLSSSSTSSSESEDEVVRKKRKKKKEVQGQPFFFIWYRNWWANQKNAKKQRPKRNEKLEAAKDLAKIPTQSWQSRPFE